MHTLINPHRLRQSIKRLFTGRFDEVFGELFQNSQRAGAKTVRIHTGAEGWTYRDDGHGIPDIDGFRTLLSLGDSGFENPEVESFQHPMGLGFHALLALEGIESVTVSSVGGSVKDAGQGCRVVAARQDENQGGNRRTADLSLPRRGSRDLRPTFHRRSAQCVLRFGHRALPQLSRRAESAARGT